MTTPPLLKRFIAWLQQLSFRTGVIVLSMCVLCYITSFAQAILPISVAAKGIFLATFFGLAKALQYRGHAILGVDGYKRLKAKLKR